MEPLQRKFFFFFQILSHGAENRSKKKNTIVKSSEAVIEGQHWLLDFQICENLLSIRGIYSDIVEILQLFHDTNMAI